MEQNNKRLSPAGVFAFVLMMFSTLAMLFVYCSDAIEVLWHNRYFDGWRYLLPLAVHLLLFTIAALLYFFNRRWKQLLYIFLLGVLIVMGSGVFPIAVWSAGLCILILFLLIVFRKQFLF